MGDADSRSSHVRNPPYEARPCKRMTGWESRDEVKTPVDVPPAPLFLENLGLATDSQNGAIANVDLMWRIVATF